jgi:anaerobic magnesium-protoporphyrin IX monomethyl ester cyclase
VCLIQPPSSLLLEDKVMPPLGILYLASWLRKYGHDVSIIDLAGVDDWTLHMKRERRKLEDATWIGITSTTPQYGISRQICAYIKATSHKPVVVGGIHTTSLVHANELDFQRRDGFDSYVVGEGYNAVTRVCEDLSENRLRPTYTEPILADVNLLPFAARDLIDIRSYKYKLGEVSATTFYSQYGCPYACQYCESPMAGSFTVRAMTPQRIQDEVREIRDKYGIHGIMFFDDEINLDRTRMLGICDKLRELGDIVWRGFVVTAKFDDTLARACKDSGCYEIASGIESGSPTILKNIRKPATVQINRRFIRTAKRAGLRCKAFCIVGLPGESWETIRETDQFFEGLRQEGYAPDDVDFSILQIYPGAPLYQKPQDIEFDSYTDFDKMYYKSAPNSYAGLIQVKTKQMSKEDLIAARNYLEEKWKPKDWVKDHTSRKDLDRVYETIHYARKRILRT